MNKLILGATFLMVIASCSKEISFVPPSSELHTVSGSIYEKIMTYMGENKECEGPEKDCYYLKEVIITPHAFGAASFEIMSATETGNLLSKPENIDFVNKFSAEISAKLLSGEYVLDESYSGEDVITYCVGKQHPANTVDNFEFAIQVNKN